MDDSMDSFVSPCEEIEVYPQLSNLWKETNMFARKSLSNSTEVMDKNPVENRTSKVELHPSEFP